MFQTINELLSSAGVRPAKHSLLDELTQKIRIWYVIFLGSSLLAFVGLVYVLIATTPPDYTPAKIADDRFSHLQIRTYDEKPDPKVFLWGLIQISCSREIAMEAELEAHPAHLTGEDLAELKKLAPHIVRFDCRHVIVPDEFIHSVAASRKLTRLGIDARQLTSQAFESIANCHDLSELSLYHFQCRDADLAGILTPSKPLIHVFLEDGPLGAESLAALHGHPSLLWLSMDQVELAEWVTPAGAKAHELQVIDVFDCRPTAGISTLLAQHTNLKMARLAGGTIDDSTCKTLTHLDKLRYLRLDKTAITNHGIQYLLSHAPRIEILSLMGTPLGPEVLENIQVASPSFRGLAFDSIAPSESSVESFVKRTYSLRSLSLPLDAYSPEFIERVNSLLATRGGGLYNSKTETVDSLAAWTLLRIGLTKTP
jgi:hypothetical protein